MCSTLGTIHRIQMNLTSETIHDQNHKHPKVTHFVGQLLVGKAFLPLGQSGIFKIVGKTVLKPQVEN